MKLLHPSNFPESTVGAVCRQSSFTKLILLAIFAAIPCEAVSFSDGESCLSLATVFFS